jgi:methionine aminotransferase
MRIESKLPKVGTTIFTVMSQLAAQHGAVNLGQGFPDFDGPPLLREALARAMAEGKNQYAPMTGVLALRQAIAAKIARCYGAHVDADTEVTVTSGATEALYCAMTALVHGGDEVVVLDPCYDSYEPAIELAGARAVHVPLMPPGFGADWDRVRAAITSRTRMILVNSPHNPSGAMLDAADLDALADLTRDRDIVVLSDEVYEHIVFDGRRHLSLVGHPELRARSIVVSSFGKTWHCTGWKIGYAVAPPALSAEFRKVHQYVTFSTFTPAQFALAEAMTTMPEHEDGLPAFYEAKRDRFRALLAGTRFELLPVAGAYFQTVDYSAISDQPDAAFCEWLVREKGVAAIPVSAFYAAPPEGQHLVRFCFAKTDATLDAAAARLEGL